MRGFLPEKLLLVSKKRILRFSFSLHHHFSSSLTSEFQDWQIEVDSHASCQTSFIQMPSKYRGCYNDWEMGGINSQKTRGCVQISVLKALADTSANQREGFETCFSQEHTNDLQWSSLCCIYSSTCFKFSIWCQEWTVLKCTLIIL